MGRKPKPAALRILSGTGHRPINDQVKPNPAKLSPPEWLEEEYHDKWNGAAKMLNDLGVLMETDLMAFELLVVSYCKWKEAEEKAEINIFKSSSGYAFQNPYINIAHKYAQRLHKLLAEFGMTPSSRTKIQVEEKGNDEFSDFINKKCK